MMAAMGAPGTEQAGAMYQIVVRGGVSEPTAEAIGAAAVQSLPGRSVIFVKAVDQSQLHGVLDRLADINVEIVSVNLV